MDPATIGLLLTGATKAFNYLKQGVALGKDLESMSSQVSKWISSSSDIDHMEKRAKNPPLVLSWLKGGTIEQVALESYMAKKKLDKQRYELKNLINMSYGPQGWNELMALEGRIRKERQAAVYARQQKMDKILNWIGIVVLSITIIGLILFMAWLYREKKFGRL